MVPEPPGPLAVEETAEEQEGAEPHADPARPLVSNTLFLAVVVALVLFAEHDSTPRSSTTSVPTGSYATGGVSSRKTYLLRTVSLSVRLRARHWYRRRRRRCRTDGDAVDELATRRELDVRLWHTACLAVLTGTLDERVDLGDGEVVLDEVSDVVGDHGTPMRAGLCVVVGVAVVGAQALPAEVVAAALAWSMSVI